MKKTSKVVLSTALAICIIISTSMIVSANIKLSNSKSTEEQKKAPFDTDKFKEEKELAKEKRAPKDKIEPVSPNVPTESSELYGIVNDTESMDFSIISQNLWVGKIDGNTVHIYTGAERDDQEQSIISVVIESSTDKSIKIERYKPKKKDGALKIISEENEQLLIESKNGKKYTFHVKTHELKEK